MNFDLGAVIPARLGSSRVKDKVFVSIDNEETLLERKITQLRRIFPSDRVVVNTESELIADLAKKSGASIVFRDAIFAEGHKKSFSELIEHVVSNLEFDHVAWTPFVVPFLDTADFQAAFDVYFEKVIKTADHDSLVSVVPLKEYVWFDGRPLNYEANLRHTISQDLPNWHRVTNGLYMAPRKLMLEKKYVLGDRVWVHVDAPQCGVDIDTLFDVQIAKAYHRVSGES